MGVFGDIGSGISNFGSSAINANLNFLNSGLDTVGGVGTGLADALSGGAISKVSAARDAAKAQQRALLAAGKISQENYDKNISQINSTYDKAEAGQQPYVQAGQDALKQQQGMIDQLGQIPGQYQDSMGPRPNAPPTYTPGEFKFSITPEMQQKIDASTQAAQASGAAKGLLGSSGTIKAIQQNAANIGQQGVNDQFNQFTQTEAQKQAAALQAQQANLLANNNYNADRQFNYGKYGDDLKSSIDAMSRKYNAVSGLASGGQTATNNLGNLAVARGNAITDQNDNLAEILANNEIGIGNSNAAKINAVGAAKGGAGSSLLNTGMQGVSMLAGLI